MKKLIILTLAALLKREMESAFQALVPLTAEVSSGKTWYECK